MDYVSKWVEAVALPNNDARVVIKFLKRISSQDLAHLGHSLVMGEHIFVINKWKNY